MFDLITGKTKHMPGGGGGPILLSTTLHAALLGTIIVVPLLFVTNTLPDVPTMMAFVGAPSPPPPPPPPPAPVRAQKASPKAVPTSGAAVAPVEAPSRVEPETAVAVDEGEEGVAGGVEGGVPGGVAGGIVGGLPAEVPLPAPAPPSAAPRGPVRIGGQIQPPTLIHRVEAIYPELAIKAHVEGTVILEAIVSDDGEVQSVKVLRSITLLDKAAIAAVQQWRYSPVVLNGVRVPFVLTVVMTFNIPQERQTGRY